VQVTSVFKWRIFNIQTGWSARWLPPSWLPN